MEEELSLVRKRWFQHEAKDRHGGTYVVMPRGRGDIGYRIRYRFKRRIVTLHDGPRDLIESKRIALKHYKLRSTC